MKKCFALFLAVALLLSLTACGSTSNTGTETTLNVAQQKETQVEDTPVEQAESTSPAKQTEYTGLLRIPRRSIYVSYEKGLREKEQGATTLVYNTNDALVGLTYDFDKVYTGDVDGVAQFFAEDFPNRASTSSQGWLFGSRIDILTSEACTVNGFDSVRFTGTCSNDGEWDCHVYGYSFIINDTAFAIIGLVSAREQDPEMIATIDARVDAMAATVRTEE